MADRAADPPPPGLVNVVVTVRNEGRNLAPEGPAEGPDAGKPRAQA